MSRRFGRRQRQHLQDTIAQLTWELIKEQKYYRSLEYELSEARHALRMLQLNPYNLPEGYIVYPVKEIEKLLTMQPMQFTINLSDQLKENKDDINALDTPDLVQRYIDDLVLACKGLRQDLITLSNQYEDLVEMSGDVL